MVGEAALYTLWIPSLTAVLTMGVALFIHWRLEKDLNGRKPIRFLHVCNLLFIMMMFGGSAMSIGGISTETIEAEGWGTVFMQAYLLPFPFILVVYSITSTIFRSYMRPYVMKKGSNVVYLKPKFYKR